MDVSGLGISPLAGRTLVQYSGSLTGRDFRTIAQVAPFVVYDLVSQDCFATWQALSKLIPLIWQPEIEHIDQHIVRPHHLSLLGLNNIFHRHYSRARLTIFFSAQPDGPTVGLTSQNFTSFYTFPHIFVASGLPFYLPPKHSSHSTRLFVGRVSIQTDTLHHAIYPKPSLREIGSATSSVGDSSCLFPPNPPRPSYLLNCP